MRARIAAACVVAATSIFLAGCPNPQTYGVPRTTPAGKISHSISLEGLNASVLQQPSSITAGGTQPERERGSSTVPTLPSYMMRIGLGDRLDLGLRVVNLSSFGIDLKWNFLRTQAFDMAIAPHPQLAYYTVLSTSLFLYHLHLPILFGINVSDSVSLVPSIGATYTGVSTDIVNRNDASTRDSAITAQTLYARAGFGVNIRASKSFAVHPEATVLRGFTILEPMFITFGVGFNFGALPRYGADVDEFEDENDVHMKRQSRKGSTTQHTPASSNANGAPDPLDPAAPAPPPPGECRTTCDADEGVVSPEEQKSIGASLETPMRTLRACLDRVGGQLVEPTLLLRFGPNGQPTDVRIDVGGYENLECIQPVRTTPITVTSSKRLLRCVYRCAQ